MFRPNRVRALLRDGRATFGLLNSTGSAVATELAGRAGYDFVVIDGEHGPGLRR